MMGALASGKGILFILHNMIGLFQETVGGGSDPMAYSIPRTPFLNDWAVLAYIVITYHLILAFYVIRSEHKTGFSLPIFSTIVTHSAFLAVVVGIAMGKHYFPPLGLIRYFIPGLAPFEAKWLFAGDLKKKAPPAPAPAQSSATVEDAAPLSSADMADDYNAWLQYLAQKSPGARKRFATVKEEYDHFMASRAKTRTSATR
ncbi:MAG: hypothetical protein ABR907_16390 [Terracidiphilus sp.]|jgi:hypothetical protein